jgi:hypothetical protein
MKDYKVIVEYVTSQHIIVSAENVEKAIDEAKNFFYSDWSVDNIDELNISAEEYNG